MRTFLKKKIWSHETPPRVPRVPILGPNRGIFSKLIGPGPLGSGDHSHTSFSNGRFQALETSFHIDVIMITSNPHLHFHQNFLKVKRKKRGRAKGAR